MYQEEITMNLDIFYIINVTGICQFVKIILICGNYHILIINI